MRLRSPLKIFIAVERALFLREMDMKISIGRSGLFWTFVEPFMQVFVFVALHAAISNASGSVSSSYEPTIFLASGFLSFNLFRGILSSSIGTFAANKGLFIYKQVKPIDTLFARVLVNLFLSAIVAILFLAIGFLLHYANLLPKNPLMVFLGLAWFILFSVGVGLLAAVGNTFFVSIGKLIGIASFLLLMLSGVFFPVVSIPPVAQELLLYNPLLHFMEMIHGYYLYGLDTRYVDYTYMLYWTIVPLFLGLWLYEKLEKRIISE